MSTYSLTLYALSVLAIIWGLFVVGTYKTASNAWQLSQDVRELQMKQRYEGYEIAMAMIAHTKEVRK